jgi:hypothetical protein
MYFEIFRNTEFWSAIAGAIVGGLIAYAVQVKALREARDQRKEDRLNVREALANGLLFKMIRIHSNMYGLREHIDGCFENAKKENFDGEPWQFVLPLANPPDTVHFSSDEMGMLLSLRDDKTFNLVLPMDILHNSLRAAVIVLSSERKKLTDQFAAHDTEGTKISTELSKDKAAALRPRMIELNVLIENVRDQATKDANESRDALKTLHDLFRDKLKIRHKLEIIKQ